MQARSLSITIHHTRLVLEPDSNALATAITWCRTFSEQSLHSIAVSPEIHLGEFSHGVCYPASFNKLKRQDKQTSKHGEYVLHAY